MFPRDSESSACAHRIKKNYKERLSESRLSSIYVVYDSPFVCCDPRCTVRFQVETRRIECAGGAKKNRRAASNNVELYRSHVEARWHSYRLKRLLITTAFYEVEQIIDTYIIISR